MTSEADGYVFVKGCRHCPLRESRSLLVKGLAVCGHPNAHDPINTYAALDVHNVPPDKAHPECPLRKHSLRIALEPTA